MHTNQKLVLGHVQKIINRISPPSAISLSDLCRDLWNDIVNWNVDARKKNNERLERITTFCKKVVKQLGIVLYVSFYMDIDLIKENNLL
jgi:hypothetical protein